MQTNTRCRVWVVQVRTLYYTAKDIYSIEVYTRKRSSAVYPTAGCFYLLLLPGRLQ